MITSTKGRKRQCSRTASWQLGSPVCGVHGGGWPVRVARGEKRNPITASLVTARKASYRTVSLAFDQVDTFADPRVRQAVIQAFCFRSLDFVHRGARARLARGAKAMYAINGRTRGRPSREDVLARRALGGRYLFAALLDPKGRS